MLNGEVIWRPSDSFSTKELHAIVTKMRCSLKVMKGFKQWTSGSEYKHSPNEQRTGILNGQIGANVINKYQYCATLK